MQKIGKFLAELRKEKNLTQDELGEKIGVTNKTVSRWENGNYLPPVEMLQILSDFYNISINEILSGERLNDADYRKKADDNIVTALSNSTAALREKSAYYKKQWMKKHWIELTVEMLGIIAMLVCGLIFDEVLLEVGAILSIAFALLTNARIDEYILKNIYEEKNAADETDLPSA